MVVKLDLRIPGRELKNKNEMSSGHLILFSLVALFFISSFLVITVSTWRTVSLNYKRTELLNESIALNNKLTIMDKEFSRLTARNGAMESKIDFILDDVPSIEFLSYLVSFLPDGLSIESVNMTTTELTIIGKSRKEETVLALITTLTSSNIVESVELPSITLGANGMFSYTLNCRLMSMLRIKLNEIKNDNITSLKDYSL